MKLPGKLQNKREQHQIKTEIKQENKINNKKQNEKEAGHYMNERDKINRYFMIFLLIASTIGFLYIVKVFFIPVLVSLTLATLFYPMYSFVYRMLGGRKNLASLLSCILVILVLLVPVYGVIHLLTKQMIIFYKFLDSKDLFTVEGLKNYIQILENTKVFSWITNLNIDWMAGLRDALGSIGQVFSVIIEKTSSQVINLVVNTLITLFTLFYFFRDGQVLLKKLRYYIPLRSEYEERILTRFATISRATINGTLVLGAIQGGIGALTLLVFGVETWIIWGIIMIITAVIPVLGTWIIMVPAGIIMLLSGRIFAGITIIAVSILVIGVIDNLLRPRLVGSTARMHDLLIFFSTLGGIAVFGVIGFIVGPVITAFFTSLLTIYGMEFKEALWPEDSKNASESR